MSKRSFIGLPERYSALLRYSKHLQSGRCLVMQACKVNLSRFAAHVRGRPGNGSTSSGNGREQKWK